MKHSEFSLSESLSNSSNGKTSIGKVLGTLVVVCGLIFFAYSLVFLVNNANFALILTQILALIGIGAGLIFNKINNPTKTLNEELNKESENI